MTPKIKSTAAALAIFGLSHTLHAPAQTFSNVIVFGDSLSDGGVYGSRFTTNPGFTAAEYLAQDFGFTITPSTQGGSNYAQGGARVASDSASTPSGFAQRSVSTQVKEYLSSTGYAADPNALYVLQGGANDIFQNLAAVQQGAMTNAQFQSSLITAGATLSAQAALLNSSGAKYIILPNLPNLGVTPAFASTMPALASQTAQGFNTVVQTVASQTGVDIIAADTYKLISEVVANPSQYGFSNATGVACTTASSLTCNPNTLVSANAPSTYVFADGVHPSTATQRLNAQYLASIVRAPTQISLLGAAPLAGSAARMRSLQASLAHSDNNTWHTFVDYDRTRSKFDRATSNANTFLAGLDHKLGKGNAGISFGYQQYSGSFGHNAGKFTLKEPSVGLYYSQLLGDGGAAGNVIASLNYGALNTSNLKRTIQLGAATRTETGDTSGQHWSAGIAAQFNLGKYAQGKASHGPMVRLNYEDIKIDGYAEQSTSSTAMTFDKQTRHGLTAALGYQTRATLGAWTPYAQLNYEFDGTRGNDVRAHLTSMYGSFTTPALETRDGLRAQVGTGVRIGNATQLNLNVGSTLGKNSGKELSANLGLDAHF